MSKENGGPAFPSSMDITFGDYRVPGHSGMTLRDYFAAKAMQGFVSVDSGWSSLYIVAEAYKLADAMLKERSE